MPTLAVNGGPPVRTTPFPSYPVFGEEEAEAAAEVVRTSILHSELGEQVEAFEQEYAAYHDVAHSVACSNGTTALHLAIAAAGAGVGDEVIVPPYTFFVTATSVLMHNAIPVFADIERETLGLDADSVAAKITPRTKGIILVHVNGFPAAHARKLMALAKERELTLIEDCAHAHGAEFHGRKTGTIGHAGAFSFQHKKNLSLGEGGMVLTGDADLAEKARKMRSFGRPELGFNYRMYEIHGAIGRIRLKRLDAENALRAANARYLDRGLAGLSGIEVRKAAPDTKPVHYTYVLSYHEEELGLSRGRFLEAVNAEGIMATAGYQPVYRHPTFRIRNAYNRGCPWSCPHYEAPAGERPSYDDGICPVAEEMCERRNIEIKIHPPAGEAEMADIVTVFRKVVENVDELRSGT